MAALGISAVRLASAFAPILADRSVNTGGDHAAGGRAVALCKADRMRDRFRAILLPLLPEQRIRLPQRAVTLEPLNVQ